MRVLIVDDQVILRSGLAALMELEDDMEVVGLAENGAVALEMAEQFGPDVVLMDVRMPVMDGIEATAALVQRGGPPVVLLTTFEEVEDMLGGLNAGAIGYLFKTAEIDTILHALRSAVKGVKVIDPKVAVHLAGYVGSARPAPAQPTDLIVPEALTRRELEVLLSLAAGHSNKRIALQLGITESTVKVYVGNVIAKLDATNRTDAVRRGRELGLVE
ncbi:response regulator transcription factor [Deinococcus sp.]|uniref:response regulator n=1 Tax=Deinococcus sp. TaxID=47478 RepID=UPI0025ED5790|nr:response regulator transcription factor [Deinococcus sp.]